MRISARVENSQDKHHVLLFLALATCYCNDIYREAANRGITIKSVEVMVSGDFEGVGNPATNVTYQATVRAQATEDEIHALMKHTDDVAEIQNSLRVETKVVLETIDAIPD